MESSNPLATQRFRHRCAKELSEFHSSTILGLRSCTFSKVRQYQSQHICPERREFEWWLSSSVGQSSQHWFLFLVVSMLLVVMPFVSSSDALAPSSFLIITNPCNSKWRRKSVECFTLIFVQLHLGCSKSELVCQQSLDTRMDDPIIRRAPFRTSVLL